MSLNVNRRDFLKVLGLSGAGAGLLTGCYPRSPTREYLNSRVSQPPEQTPGEAVLYATTDPTGNGLGVLARTREGRVVKLEGNPEHPGSLGAVSARAQAQTQGLYNPDRLSRPMLRGESGELVPIEWPEAMAELERLVRRPNEGGRAPSVAWLTGEIADSDADLIDDFAQTAGARAAVNLRLAPEAPLAQAAGLLCGHAGVPEFRFGQARMVVSFAADFLETWGDPVAQIAGYTQMHAYREGVHGRSVHVGPRQSNTAASCDEWLQVAPGLETAALRVMLDGMGGEGERPLVGYPVADAEQALGAEAAGRLREIGAELAQSRPGLVVASAHGPDAVLAQALALLATQRAGGFGATVVFPSRPRLPRGNAHGDVVRLLEDVRGGTVEVLLVHSANPAFLLPGAAEALESARAVVYFGTQHDETAHRAHLVLPIHHFLETWGDHQFSAGAVGLIQPAMLPVPKQLPNGRPYPTHVTHAEMAKFDTAGMQQFDTRAFADVLLSLGRALGLAPFVDGGVKTEEEHFVARVLGRLAENPSLAGGLSQAEFLHEAKRRGVLTWDVPEVTPALSATASLPSPSARVGVGAQHAAPPQALFFPHPFWGDGRDADKPWLQEIPETSTAAVWNSWAEIHPRTAEALGVAAGDAITLRRRGAGIPAGLEITVAVLPLEQVMPGVVAVPIGQGHEQLGRWAQGRGANPLRLASVGEETLVLHGFEVEASPVPGGGDLVRTTFMQTQLGRPLAQATGLSQAETRTDHPGVHFDTGEPGSNLRSMYERHEAQVHDQFMWGMTVDLDACVGCGACVAACYAENNVPVVGERNVQQGREMSWIRIEKYIETNHEVRFLPNLCQHCHNAPCEPVCPVHAAYHTHEGLNGQVYNRCVGTRYCSNNCVYKVRRFNWFDYHQVPEPMNLLFNPDVTVRELGVMEKCTMCVQRIRKGREDARRMHPEDPNARPEEGAIVPACAQACPAKVFTFGNMADPSHRVNEVRRGPRGYHLLGDLGTRPSVTYLKKVLRAGEIVGVGSVHHDEAHPSPEAAEHLPGHETEPSAP